MTKSPDAFRTISEVAEWLDRPAHVLRFWESKFSQVKPIKRAGGRRYFRPQDMLLLGGIKKLLHDDGLTIKGVQKILRENGVDHVAAMSQPLDEQVEAGAMVPSPEKVASLKERAENPESATLLQFPSPEEAAEEELVNTGYDDAVEELAPVAQPAQDELPETPEPEMAEDNFETPSFFSMFEAPETQSPPQDEASEPPQEQGVAADVSVAPDADAVADSDDAPIEAVPPHTRQAAPDEPAPEEPGRAAPTDAPLPHVVEVELEARSDAGPAILTRMAQSTDRLRAADRAQLKDIRTRLTQLRDKFSNKAVNG